MAPPLVSRLRDWMRSGDVRLGSPVEVNGRVGRVMGRTIEAEPRYEVRFTDGSTEQEVPAAKVWPLAKEE